MGKRIFQCKYKKVFVSIFIFGRIRGNLGRKGKIKIILD
jgi:hypothetical protein